MKTIALKPLVMRCYIPHIILLFAVFILPACVGEEGIHQTKIYVSAQTLTVDVVPTTIDTASVLPTHTP